MAYRVEIRSTAGEYLTGGQGDDWRETACWLYECDSIGPGREIASSQYFRTDAGAPIGTWHVQFGRPVPAGGMSLDPTVIVKVSAIARA